MNTRRPSQRLLSSVLPSRASSHFHIRQWHTRIPQPCSQPARRYQTTYGVPAGHKPRSRIRPYIYIAFFVAIGVTCGDLFRTSNLFSHIEKGSEKDKQILSLWRRKADNIPLVRQMLEWHHAGDSEWCELPILPHEGDELLNEILRGSGGVMTPRAFWNAKERELRMVVHYGGAVCGWPGIAHGGCTATILLEGMGRALNADTGAGQTRLPADPSHFGLTYLKPVQTGNDFYIMKVKLESSSTSDASTDTGLDAAKDLSKKVDEEKSGLLAVVNTKYDVDCVLEDLNGVQYMKAKGVWDVL